VRVVQGAPGDVLASEGESKGCRLVVLGPRSKKDLLTWLLGSTAERVIRRCRTPVLVVHQPATHAYERALASLDFESASRRALESALKLKLVPDGGLAVAHAFFAPLRRAVGLADIPIKTQEEHVQKVGNEALGTAIATVSALGLDGLRVPTRRAGESKKMRGCIRCLERGHSPGELTKAPLRQHGLRRDREAVRPLAGSRCCDVRYTSVPSAKVSWLQGASGRDNSRCRMRARSSLPANFFLNLSQAG
jgi:nucleotide-binding universal stress UspA family protein